MWPSAMCGRGVYKYGAGTNHYWATEVPTTSLQSSRSKALVEGMEVVSLDMFIDWASLANLGNNFTMGPDRSLFECPIKFWSVMKILIIDHHAALCGVNLNGEL